MMAKIHYNSQKWSNEDPSGKTSYHENITIRIDSIHMAANMDYSADPCGYIKNSFPWP
jgi:hypothetical protein